MDRPSNATVIMNRGTKRQGSPGFSTSELQAVLALVVLICLVLTWLISRRAGGLAWYWWAAAIALPLAALVLSGVVAIVRDEWRIRAAVRSGEVPSTGSCLDAYVLVEDRSKSKAEAFLAKFAPGFRPLVDEYDIPYRANQPERFLRGTASLLEFMEANASYRHVAYFAPRSVTPIRYAIVAFTTDGHMILGLSVIEEEENLARTLLARLEAFAESDLSFYAAETPPSPNRASFLEEMTAHRASRG